MLALPYEQNGLTLDRVHISLTDAHIKVLGIETAEKTVKTLAPLAAKALQDQNSLDQRQQRLHDLTREEKDVLRLYVMWPTRTREFPFVTMDGVISSLVHAKILYRANEAFSGGGMVTYNLEDWAFNYLTQHPELVGFDPEAELQRVHDEAVKCLPKQRKPHAWREVAGVHSDLGHFNLIDAATGLPRPIRNWADLDASLPVRDY